MDLRMNKGEKIALWILAALMAAVAVAASLVPEEQTVTRGKRKHIRSVLQLQNAKNRRSSLVVGYNYELMHRYAHSNKQSIEIGISYDGSGLDSLRTGAVDLVAIPYSDTLRFDGLICSHHIDSLSVWVMRSEDRHEMRDLQVWLKAWRHSDEHKKRKDIYLKRFDPFRSRPRKTLSPYDDIIKAQADSLGMDWHMLAAVIYQESRFHIEARSHKGASGLMQMMPVTATRYGVSDPLDPVQNIAAGSLMLNRLHKRYTEVAANEVESFKLALAAYNAGVGRIKSLLNFAISKGACYDHWDSLKLMIPLMNEQVQLDSTANFLTIKGSETVRYVDRVFALYNEFKRICPR